MGTDVTIYQGVTLGGTGKGSGKRHPTLRDGEFVGNNANILGNIVIGENSRVGAQTGQYKDRVVKRISGRRICRKEGHVYHVDLDPPKHEGHCDIDGSELEQRDDDLEQTVRNRLEVYHAQTEPLIAYYEERGLLRRFDGTRSPTQVHERIRATLATLRLEEDL